MDTPVNITLTGCFTAEGGILKVPHVNISLLRQKVSCPKKTVSFESVYVGEELLDCPYFEYVECLFLFITDKYIINVFETSH